MTTVEIQGDIEAPIEKVWAVVSDFGGFLEVQGVPATTEGEGIGMIRKINFGRTTVAERLESVDEATHTTSYSIVEGPMPFTDYLGTMKLTATGDGTTHLTWSSTFEPTGDVEQAKSLVETIYASGLKGLQRHFGGG